MIRETQGVNGRSDRTHFTQGTKIDQRSGYWHIELYDSLLDECSHPYIYAIKNKEIESDPFISYPERALMIS